MTATKKTGTKKTGTKKRATKRTTHDAEAFMMPARPGMIATPGPSRTIEPKKLTPKERKAMEKLIIRRVMPKDIRDPALTVAGVRKIHQEELAKLKKAKDPNPALQAYRGVRTRVHEMIQASMSFEDLQALNETDGRILWAKTDALVIGAAGLIEPAAKTTTKRSAKKTTKRATRGSKKVAS